MIIERTFDAPASRLWPLWTDPEHFAGWYGPSGAVVTVVEMDVRVGGARIVELAMGPHQMRFTGEHLVVEEPVHLAYTEAMALHPAVTEVHVELAEEAGRTTLRLTHVGIEADSPGASGWTMALDKLELALSAG